jgi:hypothetical protein
MVRSCRQPGIEAELSGRYGRRVIDLDRGWPAERVDLEPPAVAHAAELAPLLDDAPLHKFTGGAPLSAAALAARFARSAVRRSPDGDHLRGNWVLRVYQGEESSLREIEDLMPNPPA